MRGRERREGMMGRGEGEGGGREERGWWERVREGGRVGR